MRVRRKERCLLPSGCKVDLTERPSTRSGCTDSVRKLSLFRPDAGIGSISAGRHFSKVPIRCIGAKRAGESAGAALSRADHGFALQTFAYPAHPFRYSDAYLRTIEPSISNVLASPFRKTSCRWQMSTIPAKKIERNRILAAVGNLRRI
jgi:hypothetical protein